MSAVLGTGVHADAAAVALELAEGLSDAATMRTVMAGRPPVAPGQMDSWDGTSLSHGPLALALLCRTVLPEDAGARAAKGYLTLAAGSAGDEVPARHLFQGLTALAYAIRISRSHPSHYGQTLERLDRVIAADSKEVIAELGRHRKGPRGYFEFDLVSGLTGVARYMLLDVERFHEELERLATALCDFATPRLVRGITVPGWWADMEPYVDVATPGCADGHLNFGLAHGICGPMTVLSAALAGGIEVPGQRAVAEGLLDRLLDSRRLVGGLLCWPTTQTLNDLVAGSGTAAEPCGQNLSWCYGTPGIARSLQLASVGLGRADAAAVAVEAAASIVSSPTAPGLLGSAGLCHGTAGLLHVIQRIAADAAVDGAAAFADRLAADLLAAVAAEPPFHLRTAGAATPPLGDPGLLNGTAGIALALWHYANGLDDCRWDSCLLLS